MNRAYSLLNVKSVQEDLRLISGIATTPSTDRQGDIVEPLGITFRNPMPLLHNHRSDQPVGTVTFDQPTKNGITFTARLPTITEPGPLKDRVDTAWGEVKAGLVRAVSIGFRVLEDGIEMMKGGGARFLSTEVLELSLVAIPAQSEATILTVRSIDAEVMAASGRKDLAIERPTTSAGVSATKRTTVVRAQEGIPKMATKAYGVQIAEYEATLASKNAAIDAIMDKSAEDGVTLDEAQKEEYDTLIGETKQIEEHIGRLRLREDSAKKAAVAVQGKDQRSGSEARHVTSIPATVRAAKTPTGYGYVRLLSARFQGKEQGVHPAEIAKSRGWGDDVAEVLRMPQDVIQKAAIAAANTTDSTWAGPLVTYNNLQEEFIALLRPKSLLDRIPGIRKVPFNIKVPRETGATTAYWVGQGSPKPVSAGSLDTVTLDFNKVAGITFQTQELLRFSRPNSEQLMIDSLTKAITYLVDRDFLDPSKAVSTGVSPASVTNGSTSITATGITADAFRADFGSLLALYSQANYTLDGLVFVMTQTQAMRLGLMRNDFGTKEFPDVNKDGGTIEGFPVVTTENIVANGGSPADGAIVVAMNANDILLADDGQVQVDVSTEASIQADSAPDSPATASTVLVSLWQNNLVGIRCERFVSWVKARTNSVVYIAGANYHT